MWRVKEIGKGNEVMLEVFILSTLNAGNFIIFIWFGSWLPEVVDIIIPFLKAKDLGLREGNNLPRCIVLWK